MKDGNEMDSKSDKIITDAEKLAAEVQSETHKQNDCKCENNLDNINIENNDDKQANYKKKNCKDLKLKIAVGIGVLIVFISAILVSNKNLYWIGLFGSLFGLFIIVASALYTIIRTFKEVCRERKEKIAKVVNINVDSKQSPIDGKEQFDRYCINNKEINQNVDIKPMQNKPNSEDKQKQLLGDANKKLKIKGKILFRRLKVFAVLSFLLVLVGGGIANITYIGFILLGLGILGFVGIVLYFVLKCNYERKKYLKYTKVDKSLLNDFYNIRVGVCAKCMQHSQASSSKSRHSAIDTLYVVWVLPLDGEDILHVNVEEPDFDSRIQLRMISNVKYEVGDRVKFYQNKNNEKDCYVIC